MATREDAEAGWRIFQAENYALTLDEINDRLIREGHSPVSLRMYGHYRKLVRYGYENYIPINQLDVKTLQNPIWDAAMRNRYVTREVELRVTLRVLRDDIPTDLEGQAVRISDGVVVIRLRGVGNIQVVSSSPNLKDRLAQVIFHDTGEIRLAKVDVVSLNVESELVTVRLSFLEFAPLERTARREALGSTDLQVTIEPLNDEVYLGSLVQGIYWLFQALEASRVMCEEILVAVDTDQRFTLPAPRVERLTLASPLDAFLSGGEAYIIVVGVLIERLASSWKKIQEGKVAKQDARRLKWEQDQREAAEKISTKRIAAIATQAVLDSLKAKGVDVAALSDADNERTETFIRKQIIPAVLSLVQTSENVSLSSKAELPPSDDEDETSDSRTG